MKLSVIFIIIVFFVSFFLAFLGVDTLPTILVIGSIAFVYIFLVFSPVVFSKDLKKIEKFLKDNLKTPVYYFLYSIVNDRKTDVEAAYEKVVQKYKDPSKLAIFHTTYALYKDDLEAAYEHILFIKPPVYQNYYKASILIEEGNLEAARKLVDTLPKKWMKATVLGEVYKREGNLELAYNYAKEALENSRGIQRYSIYKSFEEILEGTERVS